MNLKLKRFLLVLASLFLAACAFADVKVVSVKGKCEYESEGRWNTLAPGLVLSEGTRIQTGFKSEVILKLFSKNEDSTITVAQLSRMTIEQLISSDKMDKTNVSLSSGTIRSEINRTGTAKVNFTIKSPVATASVRGTIVEAKAKVKSVKYTTKRGKVAVCETKKLDEAALADPDAEVPVPAGAVEVVKNQSVDFSDSGKNKGTRELAASSARETGGLKTAAESESNSFANNGVQQNSHQSGNGKINVSVVWEG